MNRVDSSNANVLEYAHMSRTVAWLIAAPFFAFGGFVIFSAFNRTWLNKNGDKLNFAIFMGLLFEMVGALIVLYRSGVVFDKTSGIAIRSRGILSYSYSATRVHLVDTRCVSVSHHIEETQDGSVSRYPVQLRNGTDVIFDIDESKDEATARRLAEEIALFLRLPLRDYAGGKVIMRYPTRAD
jgi:hypothetical protein